MKSDKFSVPRAIGIILLGLGFGQALTHEVYVVATLVGLGTILTIFAYQKAVKNVIDDAHKILHDQFRCATCQKFTREIYVTQIGVSEKRLCADCYADVLKENRV